MKVIAFNSSPRMDKGNTALILTPFLEGMSEAGAEIELSYTKKLNINPCQGNFICWFKTPGKCFQKDDMQMLYPKLREADIWVFATPVYVDGITGPMKNLIDRLIPLIQPYFEMRDDHCRHSLCEGTKHGKVVLVSTCGFWEMDNFDPLLVHMKAACKNMNREFAGALLRPHGATLRGMMKRGIPMNDILEAAKEAGYQLVETGEMSYKTLETISRELMQLETYFQQHNEETKQVLDALEKK